MDFMITDPTPEYLRMARLEARLTLDDAAKLCGLHHRTYAQQESGKTAVKLAVYRLLLCKSGLILDPAWSGWQFRASRLWSPDDVDYTPGDLLALPWMDQSIRFLRAELYEKTGDYYDQAWFHGYRFRNSTRK